MFARFDENPGMTLQDIKETKRYGRTHGQRENSIPNTNKVCGGYKQTKFAGGITRFLSVVSPVFLPPLRCGGQGRPLRQFQQASEKFQGGHS